MQQPFWGEDSKFDVSVSGGERSSAVATLGSFFCPGLGHMYCGQLGRALMIFLFPYALVVLLTMLWANSSEHLDTNFLLILACFGIVYLPYLAYDAYRLSRNVSGEFTPRPYNKPSYYAVYVLGALALVIGGCFFLCRLYVTTYQVPNVGMMPGLLQGDSLLANIASYRHHTPRRGEVALFADPRNPQEILIGRVVGLPGDRVLVATNGTLILNGNKERFAPTGTLTEITMPDGFKEQVQEYVVKMEEDYYRIAVGKIDPERTMRAEVQVPPDHYFILGDFRSRTIDSRDFGTVPRALFKAKAGSVSFSVGAGEGVRWKRSGGRVL